MSEMNNNFDPAGEINEEELKEITEGTDVAGGTDLGVAISATVALSAALCPTTKCSSKC